MQSVIHSGIITEVHEDHVNVVLNEAVACTSCQLKSACGADQADLKELKVLTRGKHYNKGTAVTVGMHQSMGLKAVLLAYVVPFIILMTVLILSQNVLEEWLSGLLVLAFIVVYFWLLKRLDKIISKYIHIEILKTT